jgi:hypothetical protein
VKKSRAEFDALVEVAKRDPVVVRFIDHVRSLRTSPAEETPDGSYPYPRGVALHTTFYVTQLAGRPIGPDVISQLIGDPMGKIEASQYSHLVANPVNVLEAWSVLNEKGVDDIEMSKLVHRLIGWHVLIAYRIVDAEYDMTGNEQIATR